MARMSKKSTTGGSTGGMRASSTWILGTALFCGMTTFIVSDRFYHSLEISQLLVVSIDTMNVGVTPMIKEPSRPPLPPPLPPLLQEEGPKVQVTATKSSVEKTPVTLPKNEKSPRETTSPPMQQKRRRTQKELNVAASKETLAPLTDLGQITTGPKQRLTVPQQPMSPLDINIRAMVVRSLENDSHDNNNSDRDDAGHKVYFLNETQVSQKDSFSASWIMTKQDFLDMPLHPVQQCEDAAFKAWNWRRHKLRMTMDYLDFRYVLFFGLVSNVEKGVVLDSPIQDSLRSNSFSYTY